jgi:hypothetical protein
MSRIGVHAMEEVQRFDDQQSSSCGQGLLSSFLDFSAAARYFRLTGLLD